MCNEIPIVLAEVPSQFLQAIIFPKGEPENLLANLHLGYYDALYFNTLQQS
jgi:hypothetical protein